jgi:hypothetical protein
MAYILYSGVMLIERVTGHTTYILLMNIYHIYHSYNDVRTTDPSIAISPRTMMMMLMSRRCPINVGSQSSEEWIAVDPGRVYIHRRIRSAINMRVNDLWRERERVSRTHNRSKVVNDLIYVRIRPLGHHGPL